MGSSSSLYNPCFVSIHFRGKQTLFESPCVYKNYIWYSCFTQIEAESSIIDARSIAVMIVTSGAVIYGLIRYWLDHRWKKWIGASCFTNVTVVFKFTSYIEHTMFILCRSVADGIRSRLFTCESFLDVYPGASVQYTVQKSVVMLCKVFFLCTLNFRIQMSVQHVSSRTYDDKRSSRLTCDTSLSFYSDDWCRDRSMVSDHIVNYAPFF